MSETTQDAYLSGKETRLPERLSSINEIIEQKFSPKIEADQASYYRQIYSYKGSTFAFKGKEELPIYPTLNKSKTVILGEPPNWITKDEYARFEQVVRATQSQETTENHFLVNKTLLGVVDLAIHLGAVDPSLIALRQELREWKFSSHALELIDELLALNFIDDNNTISETANNNAEAIMLLHLLGDSSVDLLIRSKTQSLYTHLNDLREKQKEKIIEGVEPYDIKKVVCVHATRYMPESTTNGFCIPTTFDATRGKWLVNSVHTALQHKVTANTGGDWGEADFTLISPFESLVSSNGLPQVLFPVDTYWVQDPGKPFTFSDGTLVEPANSNIPTLYEQEGNVVRFKSEQFGPDHIKQLLEQQNEDERQLFANALDNIIEGVFDVYIENEKLEGIINIAHAHDIFTRYANEIKPQYQDLTYMLHKLTDKQNETDDMKIRIQKIIEEAGLGSARLPDVSEGDAVEGIVETIQLQIQKQLRAETNRVAVNYAIKSRGFEVQTGGYYEWGRDGQNDKKLRQLAACMGVEYALHSGTDHSKLINYVESATKAFTDNSQNLEYPHWYRYDPFYGEQIPRVDTKTLRALYASGLLTSRE
ncbi:hypothetical protein HGB07_05685 [Candidatus Roizmanbacteria bacterium]|nr:hypothetical protein [Candidatus Roizmanbacteria bacterium]